ncbi:MAG: GAF domain-containing protein [Cyanobacteria bacterium REEB67]|nr:GAF domain-containing protein [Cyanobacteria bacterium REEB67]
MTSERTEFSQTPDLHMLEVLRLLQQLVFVKRDNLTGATGGGGDREQITTELEADMRSFCQALELKRAVVLEALYDDYFDGLRLVPLASYSTDGDESSIDSGSRGRGGLPIATKSEVFKLLHEGQWIPLGQSSGSAGANTPHVMRELADFLELHSHCSAVLFPLNFSAANQICGLVLMERDSKAGGFSENLLDLGAVISQMLESRLMKLRLNSGANVGSDKNFGGSGSDGKGRDSKGAPSLGLAENFAPVGCDPALDGAVGGISLTGENKHSKISVGSVGSVSTTSGGSGSEKKGSSRANLSGGGTASGAASGAGGDPASLSDISRRLNFERWLRQTVCKLHSSLDRDHVLQTLADSLGRAFRATRCLIIRTDGPSHPMVTHEYVEPDLSPLGLGRTGQFPIFVISLFSQKTISYADVSQIKSTGPLIPTEVDQLLDSGIMSMAGAPLSYQGQPFGVLILVDGSRARLWTEEELETIELTASQASVALSHSQTYHQVKDQLFHMNLLGNLTQQLTNALEVATKAPTKSSGPSPQDKNSADGALTPLSSREMEVLRLIASGYANREIAQRLFLTESTVELHASRIRKKLHLKSRTALVKYACDNSLV